MATTKVTNSSILSVLIFGNWWFCHNLHGISSRPQKEQFFDFVRGYGWNDISLVFVDDFFHTVQPIKMKSKTYHYSKKIKHWLVFDTYRSKNSTLFHYIFRFIKISWNKLNKFLLNLKLYFEDPEKCYIQFLVKLHFKVFNQNKYFFKLIYFSGLI